jgi:hypothetical protein
MTLVMIDLITLWARRVACPFCSARPLDDCATVLSDHRVHEERVLAQPVAAALQVLLDMAGVAHRSADDFNALVTAAVVAVVELAANDHENARTLSDALDSAMQRARR